MIKLAAALLFLGMQGQFYFMMVAFSTPGTDLRPALAKFLDRSILLLPGVCAAAAVVVLVGHFRQWSHPYIWCLAPIPLAVLWFVIRLKLG